MNQDLTVGEPKRVLWRFCLPLFGSVIFQQIYNVADSFVAGKFVGENALAAVGNSYEVTLLFIAFAFGCNIGTSVVVARLFGAKAYRDVKTAVYTSLIASSALCLLLMAAGFLLSRTLLVAIDTPQEILADSALYLDIYIAGLPFLFLYNVSTGIFSAMGDSKTPFYFLVASSLANIGMDVLFVTAFQMGVAGVAWATFLCQGVSCVLAVSFMLARLRTIRSEKAPVFSFGLLLQIARIAIPSTLQQSFVSVGNILLQRVINGFGASVIAGYSASIKLNNLVVTSLVTLGNGISNFTAQNLGANRPDRVHGGFRAGFKLVWLICIPFALLYAFAGQYLLRLFLDDPAGKAMATGVELLRIVAPGYFLVSAKLVADGVLRGSGLMKRFMLTTLIDLVLRVGLAKLFASSLGTHGIWIAFPIGWAISMCLSLAFYWNGPWRKAQPVEPAAGDN